jgi:predicted DNA-binding antitoxin AbrB/MazE fold protein
MTIIKTQAVYTKGLLKPATQLNLSEGAKVEIQISELPLAVSGTPADFGSLAGIWSDLSDDDLQNLEQRLATVRQQSTDKMARLAQGLIRNQDQSSG